MTHPCAPVGVSKSLSALGLEPREQCPPQLCQGGACGYSVPLAHKDAPCARSQTSLDSSVLFPPAGMIPTADGEVDGAYLRKATRAQTEGEEEEGKRGDGRTGEIPDAEPPGASGSVECRRGQRCPGPRTSPAAAGASPGSGAYLVLHAVQAGADRVAATVLRLLCGVKHPSEGLRRWPMGWGGQATPG